MIERRIKTARKRCGRTQIQLAETVGVSVDTERRWESGSRTPDATMLPKLAKALHTTTAYLLGEVDEPGADVASSGGHVTEVTWVPVVDDANTVCCGRGTAYADEVEWNVVGHYPVPSGDLIGSAWALRDGGFRIFTVEGDSMSPRIEDGDRILFADAELVTGDIGLVRYRGRYMVRGVFFEGDAIRLQAINPAYEAIRVQSDDMEEFCILGKVLGRVPGFEKINGLW